MASGAAIPLLPWSEQAELLWLPVFVDQSAVWLDMEDLGALVEKSRRDQPMAMTLTVVALSTHDCSAVLCSASWRYRTRCIKFVQTPHKSRSYSTK